MFDINSKIAEILTGEKPEINAKQLEWGIDHEHEAVEEYSKIVNHHVEYFGIAMPKYFAKNEISGGSPDGILNDDGVLELKCPFNSTYHVKMLRCKDVEEFKKFHLDYYTQDQFNMYVLDRKWCDHVSYDPRMISPNHRLKVLRIERDDEHINLICERLCLAVEHMHKALEDLYAIQTEKRAANPKKKAKTVTTDIPEFLQ